MTPSQMGALYSAIHADPSAKEAARVGDDQAVSDRLNLPTVLVHRRISSGQLLRWSAARAVMQKLQAEATNGTNGKKSISQAALTMLESGTAELVLDTEVTGMINHLVPDVLSADDVADLLQRCAEHISVAEQSIGRQCTVADVGEVLLVDRPNGKIPRTEAV